MGLAVVSRTFLLVLGLTACADAAEPSRVRDVKPVGTLPASDAALARFVRRAELDLVGKAPSDAEVDALVARLREAADLAGERQAFVGELLDGEAYAARAVAEL